MLFYKTDEKEEYIAEQTFTVKNQETYHLLFGMCHLSHFICLAFWRHTIISRNIKNKMLAKFINEKLAGKDGKNSYS